MEHSSKLEIPPLEGDTEVKFTTSDPSRCWVDLTKEHILKAGISIVM